LTGGYVLGRRREHAVKRNLLLRGWVVFRSFRSAGGLPQSTVKPVDLVALKSGYKPLLIQVSKHRYAISQDELVELKKICVMCGAVPVLVYKKKKVRGFVFEDANTGVVPDDWQNYPEWFIHKRKGPPGLQSITLKKTVSQSPSSSEAAATSEASPPSQAPS
jgi:Holliday junction resolvase